MQLVYGEIRPDGVRGITIPRFHCPETTPLLLDYLELNVGPERLNGTIIGIESA